MQSSEYQEVMSDDRMNDFMPIRMLLTKVCYLALYMWDDKEIDNSVAKKEKQIYKNSKEID